MALINLVLLARQLRVHPMTIRRWACHLKLPVKYWTGQMPSGKVRKSACLRLADAAELRKCYREFKSRKRLA